MGEGSGGVVFMRREGSGGVVFMRREGSEEWCS